MFTFSSLIIPTLIESAMNILYEYYNNNDEKSKRYVRKLSLGSHTNTHTHTHASRIILLNKRERRKFFKAQSVLIQKAQILLSPDIKLKTSEMRIRNMKRKVWEVRRRK